MLGIKEAIEIIRLRLSRNRFKHSLQVAEVAREMAGKYDFDEEKAFLTGLLHDYAKGLSGQELLAIAEKNSLITNEIDRRVPDLLHAQVGAFLLQKDLGIKDRDILNAVESHTLGALNMSTLDKIIYLADMIEPGRDFPGMDRLKCIAFRNLDEGMLYGLETTIRYCLDQQRILHPLTIKVRNYYLQLLKNAGLSC